MKNLKSFLFIGIVLVSLFSACSHSDKYAAEIKQLDSLSLLLDSAELKFRDIDTLKIYNYVKEIETNLDFIEKNNTDTIGRDFAFAISEYSLLTAPLKKINKEYAKMGEEMEESKEHISDLIHDLKINKLEEDKAALYFQDERIAANRVIRDVEIIEKITKLNLEKFEEHNPKVLKFMEEIKTKQPAKK